MRASGLMKPMKACNEAGDGVKSRTVGPCPVSELGQMSDQINGMRRGPAKRAASEGTGSGGPSMRVACVR